MRAKLSGALLLMLVAACYAAPFGIDTVTSPPSSIRCLYLPGDVDNWIRLSLGSLLLSTMILAGVWVLSGLFSTPKYDEWRRASLWNYVETFFIVALLVSAWFAGLGKFGTDNIDKARAYSVIIRNTMMLDFSVVVGVSMLTSFISNPTISFHPFGHLGYQLSLSLASAFRPVFDLIGILVQSLTVGILEWFAHEYMLCFVKSKMLSILLPAGVFLRVFGLKGGGNALIGIALSLYFVYPLMIVQLGEIITDYFQQEIDSVSTPLPHLWDCGVTRPICCALAGVPAIFGGGHGVPDPSDPTDTLFLRNGKNWETDINDRVSVKKVLDGPIYLRFGGSNRGPSGGAGPACIFTTSSARAFKPLIDTINSLNLWAIALGGVGLSLLVKFANISPLVVILLPVLVSYLFIFTYTTTYFVFIISTVMAIFIIFVTLTFAKEIARVLGTEIDLSALEKLI
ncbi:MAG: hypothetical protein N3G22_03055 [Candidatus Micrarchaeota archaeon]|nr:hypothetical protein [Candidatus Micrarchaeota archaeon]